MSTHGTSSMAGDSAVRLLRLASQSTEMIPPVKSIVDGALRIAERVVQFKTSQDEWKEFQVYVQNAVATVLHSLASIDSSQSETKLKLEKFQATLEGIVRRIETKQRESLGWRMIRFLEHPTVIAEMRKEVDDAVGLFKLGATIRMEIAIEKVLELLQQQASKPQQSKLTTTLNPALSKLRRVEGASWNPYRVCLNNTRQNMIETILSWINNTDGVGNSKGIFLLTGVAGSGKSAISHTVAQRCDENQQLATAFFFDRDTNDRNNPRQLITTIAADLCQAGDHLRRRILATIEDNEKILYASMPQQFQGLVLEPSKDFVSKRPLVIVLDALDEGSNDDLLQILCKGACQLPPSIRIFLTSRPSPEIDILRRKPHVHSMELNIHQQDNADDIAQFIPYKLNEVAEYHNLGSERPNQRLMALFQVKAEGLFLWVATTCDYLKTCGDPTDELQSLVSSEHISESAESRMDSLYATILGTCNWNDRSFVESYHRLLGAAVATKTPLTLRALNALYRRALVSSCPTLRQLSSLIMGLSNDPHTTQLVCFLHQSLRDFVTLRAGLPSAPVESQRFAITEKSHSQTLALLCLRLLNHNLNDSLPGIGFLAKGNSVSQEIPSIDLGCISEELWYACRFWIDHIQDVEIPVAHDILEELETFLGTRLPLWMELTVLRGRYEGLVELRGWVNDKLAQRPGIQLLLYNEGQASALDSIAQHLKYMGRNEEALIAAQDEVALSRKLAEDLNTDRKAGLARSLCSLSIYLTDLGSLDEALSASDEAVAMQRELKAKSLAYSDADLARSLQRLSVGYSKLGHHEDGLVAIQEAVQLQRQLTSNKAAAVKLISNLANSLHDLQSCLYHLGRYEEALTVSQEAVGIYRRLAAERQVAFVQDLAKSISGLGANLTQLGRFTEAITMSQESVDLYRHLATERPAVFTSDLSKCLHNHSCSLSDLGRHEEALAPIQEAVALRRKLAAERPAVFTSDLAKSLHNLSCDLSAQGRHGEAFTVIQEAVQLFRPLATDRPAVFNSGLALALHQLADCLDELDDNQAAVVAIRESVELYRSLAQQYPAKYATRLSDALQWAAIYLSYTGADEEARVMREELDALSSAGS